MCPDGNSSGSLVLRQAEWERQDKSVETGRLPGILIN